MSQAAGEYTNTEWGLIASRLSHDPQNVQEQVDNIQVQVDRSVDVFLGGHLVHDHVGVIDNEEGEEESATDGQSQLYHGTLEEDLKTEKQTSYQLD